MPKEPGRILLMVTLWREISRASPATKPVKPLRALCPDQVGDEGIDVVAPGQALAGDLIEALKAV